MSMLKGIAILGAVTALFATRESMAATADDLGKIKALEAQFSAAFAAKDVDALMKVYVADDSLFVFDLVPPRQYVGADAYRKDWTETFAALPGPVTFSMSDLAVTVEGKIAYGHSVQRFTGSDPKGKPVDITVRVTDVYRKIKGKWLIVQEHVSVPVDMETGKPDYSSKP